MVGSSRPWANLTIDSNFCSPVRNRSVHGESLKRFLSFYRSSSLKASSNPYNWLSSEKLFANSFFYDRMFYRMYDPLWQLLMASLSIYSLEWVFIESFLVWMAWDAASSDNFVIIYCARFREWPVITSPFIGLFQHFVPYRFSCGA
jgi:hypothetical protein